MKTIKLTKGYETKVDDEWFPILSKWSWKVRFGNGRPYAQRNAAGGKAIIMHRYILMATGESEIDHINGDSLDNRECNLRFATRSLNMHNRGPQKNNTTGYKGVCFDKNRGKYMASISVNRKQYNLGRFDTAEEAAAAYQKRAQQVYPILKAIAEVETS